MNRIFEINARVWLNHLGTGLDGVPDGEIRRIADLGFDAVWLMGVWKPGAKGREQALRESGLRAEMEKALPGFRPEDVSSSPYAVAAYEPGPLLGTGADLRRFRERLRGFGLKLILDFVPNHLALDHPLAEARPDLFVGGTPDDLAASPESFFSPDGGRTVLAFGRDPYYPAWTDVAQLNYFNPETRALMRGTLLRIAECCDGVRCDMAMLVLGAVHLSVWGDRLRFPKPDAEFWAEAVAAVRAKHPGFIFIAEVYWGLENELLALGFDHVYDKVFYDALRSGDVPEIRSRLLKDAGNTLRFIENHDEDRAAAAFGVEKSMAAAFLLELSPGAKLIHQGQEEGCVIRQPLRLIRSAAEPVNETLSAFYRRLADVFSGPRARWEAAEALPAWEGSRTHEGFIVLSSGSGYLAAVNYSGERGQCYVRFDASGYGGADLLFSDLTGTEEYVRPKDEVLSRGLYLDVPPMAFHLFRVSAADRGV